MEWLCLTRGEIWCLIKALSGFSSSDAIVDIVIFLSLSYSHKWKFSQLFNIPWNVSFTSQILTDPTPSNFRHSIICHFFFTLTYIHFRSLWYQKYALRDLAPPNAHHYTGSVNSFSDVWLFKCHTPLGEISLWFSSPILLFSLLLSTPSHPPSLSHSHSLTHVCE